MEFLSGLDPAVIALIGTLFGGVVLKFAEHWLGKAKTSSDDAKQIREELRTQIVSQKDEINALEDEVNEWRSKYYDLRDSYIKVQTELQIALEKIKSEAADSERKLREANPGGDIPPA